MEHFVALFANKTSKPQTIKTHCSCHKKQNSVPFSHQINKTKINSGFWWYQVQKAWKQSHEQFLKSKTYDKGDKIWTFAELINDKNVTQATIGISMSKIWHRHFLYKAKPFHQKFNGDENFSVRFFARDSHFSSLFMKKIFIAKQHFFKYFFYAHGKRNNLP